MGSCKWTKTWRNCEPIRSLSLGGKYNGSRQIYFQSPVGFTFTSSDADEYLICFIQELIYTTAKFRIRQRLKPNLGAIIWPIFEVNSDLFSAEACP